jgi:hypothetical protein
MLTTLNTDWREWILIPQSEGIYLLTEGDATVTITVQPIEGSRALSVYFDAFNVSVFLDVRSGWAQMDWIKKYAHFYLKLLKARQPLNQTEFKFMKSKQLFNKILWTIVWGGWLLIILNSNLKCNFFSFTKILGME